MIISDETPLGMTTGARFPPSSTHECVPGEVWTETRGHRVLILSPRQGDLLAPGTRTTAPRPLAALYGDVAKKTARKWLKIRPSGGRVWVDRNGHACTLIDDQQIYLGALPEDWTW